ncbi:hypothetical protein PQX77_021135 [Marasmius sp. AFHP31]|nr:hypothetical protein PQX77_021135 [Marasmius sp. AFHP31]
MSRSSDINRDQNTGIISDSSSSASENDILVEPEVIRFTPPTPSIRAPPRLPASIDQFISNDDLLAELPQPVLVPEDQTGDPMFGGRHLVLQWETLILSNRDYYLGNGMGLRRPHTFFTQRTADLHRDIVFEGVNGRTTVPWPENIPNRDRLDVVLYTIYGFLSSVGIHNPANTPHAHTIQQFERIRAAPHRVLPQYRRFLLSDEGKFGFWATRLLASDPIYLAYREFIFHNPSSPLNQQSLPFAPDALESNREADAGTTYRRSSEPETSVAVATPSRQRSASVPTNPDYLYPSLSEVSELFRSEAGPSNRPDKGKGRAMDIIPEEVLPHPAETPASMSPENKTEGSSGIQRPSPIPTPSIQGGTPSVDEMIHLEEEIQPGNQSTTSASIDERFTKKVIILTRNGRPTTWKMPLEWYNNNRHLVDPRVAEAKDYLLREQERELVEQFNRSWMLIERQREGRENVSLGTHDMLMMAASRHGTRPEAQYTERAVQTEETPNLGTRETRNQGIQVRINPRIGRSVQTDLSSIPPVVAESNNAFLESIPEGEEHSDTDSHWQGSDFDEPDEDVEEIMSIQFPNEPPQTSRADRRERFTNLQKQLKVERQFKKKAIPISSGSSSEGSPPRPGPSNSQHMPSTPFPAAPNNEEEEDFIADDPEQYSNDRTNIMNYWLNLSRDPDADAKMRQALRDYDQNARNEQERRRRGASQFQEILQYNPELREILSDWKNIKKELEEGRDLRRRYLARHGGASGSGCGPCGGAQQHPTSGCSEQAPDNNVVVNLMREDPASTPKHGILQTPKRVTWAPDVKEPDTPLPTYTAQATPAPAYTINTRTAGEIDPEVYSDTEVFVQHAHEFDSPGSGSSRQPDVTVESIDRPDVTNSETPTTWKRDSPPHMDLASRGVRFAETPHNPRAGFRPRGRGADRQSTPWPGRSRVPQTPITRGSVRMSTSPEDPDDEPSDNENGDDNPFGRDKNQSIPRPGKERETPVRDPDFEALNQKTPSFFIDEDELRAEIRRINREERSRAVPVSPATPARVDVLEDRFEREARKERLATQSKIRMKDPEIFEGESREEFDPFIEECEAIYDAKTEIYNTDNAKISHCASWTGGKVQAAIRVLQKQRRLGQRVVALESWEAFVAELRKDFGLRDPTGFNQARVQKMRQREDEPYGKYFNRFSQAAVRSGFDEPSLRWYLLRGLTETTINRLRGSNEIPKDYVDLHEHLRDLDTVDHSLMEAGIIDSYDVNVGSMIPSSRNSPSNNAAPRFNQRNNNNFVPRNSGGGNPRANFIPRQSNTPHQPQQQRPENKEIKKAVTGLPAPTPSGPPPKPVGEVKWPTKEVRDQRRKDGLCILCGATDHFIPRCPHNKQIARAAKAFSETGDNDTIWADYGNGTGELVHYDDFLEDSSDEESEKGDETQVGDSDA